MILWVSFLISMSLHLRMSLPARRWILANSARFIARVHSLAPRRRCLRQNALGRVWIHLLPIFQCQRAADTLKQLFLKLMHVECGEFGLPCEAYCPDGNTDPNGLVWTRPPCGLDSCDEPGQVPAGYQRDSVAARSCDQRQQFYPKTCRIVSWHGHRTRSTKSGFGTTGWECAQSYTGFAEKARNGSVQWCRVAFKDCNARS